MRSRLSPTTWEIMANTRRDIGQRDGLRAREKDLRDHANFDPADQVLYRDGDHGYRSSYGDIELYKRDYREGFVQGYQDGYGRWR